MQCELGICLEYEVALRHIILKNILSRQIVALFPPAELQLLAFVAVQTKTPPNKVR